MATENEILIAVIKQLNPSKLDYKSLAEEIGSPNAKAANMKWLRTWRKIQGLAPNKPTGINKAAKKPGVKIGTPVKKKKGDVVIVNKAAGIEVESEESMMDTGTTEEDDLPVTPKRLPKRKASERVKEIVKMYKEETVSEGEEPEVAADEEEEYGIIEMGDIEA